MTSQFLSLLPSRVWTDEQLSAKSQSFVTQTSNGYLGTLLCRIYSYKARVLKKKIFRNIHE